MAPPAGELESIIYHLMQREADFRRVEHHGGKSFRGGFKLNIEIAMFLATLNQHISNNFIQISRTLADTGTVNHDLAECKQIGNQLTEIARLFDCHVNTLLENRVCRIKQPGLQILQQERNTGDRSAQFMRDKR